LTGEAAGTTLKVSEGAGMGEIDTSTIDGLKATLVRALEQADGSWRYAADMWNSDQN
jgi:hypothetical protein